jgi:hypothetical protein
MSLDGHLDVVVTDDTVECVFIIQNTGTDPVELDFRTGMVADVAVSEEGVEVWRWSDGRMFTQALETETLAPGASLAREMVWEEPSPGTYTAEATLSTANVSLTEQASFEV